MTEPTTPEGTRTDQVTPNPAGVPQPNPPEGGPNDNQDTPDPADLAPGFGGSSEELPESQE